MRGGRKPWVLIGRTRTEALLRYAQLEAATADRRDFHALAVKYQAEALAAHSDPRMTQSYVSGEARVAI